MADLEWDVADPVNGQLPMRMSPTMVERPTSYQEGILAHPTAPVQNSSLREVLEARRVDVAALEARTVAERGKKLSPKIKAYYTEQNELIADYLLLLKNQRKPEPEPQRGFSSAAQAARWSLACNIMLLCIKVVATALSGSLAVVGSLVDSALDLFSALVVWLAARTMASRNTIKFPVGKTRYEPLAIVVIAAVMATAALELILVSIQDLVQGSSTPDATLIPLVLLGVTIAVKLCLFLLCRMIPDPSTQALATDHSNDVISNSMTLALAYVATNYWSPADPLGAIITAVIIIRNWTVQGQEHISNLAGKAPGPRLHCLLTFAALTHDTNIKAVDTVRPYQFGNNIFAEVDIVLADDTILKIAHHVGESLQLKLECIENVERAFVHLDTESDHYAHDEHLNV